MNSYMTAEDSGAGFKKYLNDITQISLLTPAEEIALATRIKHGDAEARAVMIRSNLRLVVRLALAYTNLGLPLLDLIEEGNIGLIKAVDRFDPEKGAKLSTYAIWWIKQSIRRALANQGKVIRLPIHLADKLSRVRRISSRMSEALGREPTDDELAEEVGLLSDKVTKLKTAAIRAASLDAPITDSATMELGETIGDEREPTPFESLRDKDLREKMSGALSALSERERKIIFARFGLDGEKPQTLEDVGGRYGVTREWITQLQNTALAKLRCAILHKDAPASAALTTVA